jgi:UDP-N-acetyl-2-amino-2-deoxyglucuronate dehydrogenase
MLLPEPDTPEAESPEPQADTVATMTHDSFKIGILGSGNISDTHARAALGVPGVEIVAVQGRTLPKATQLAERYGGRAFEDLNQFLDHRPMDAVLIGSPSGLHAQHGIAAAERGFHVLVEKPLDITVERSDALIAAVQRAGVTLGVFFQDRLKPDVVQMKAIVSDGVLGRPLLASGRVKWYRPPEYYGGSRWRGTHALDGGGALINQAIHTIDLLLYVLGPIARVDARAGTKFHKIEVEDTVVATLEFENGALGVFEASTAVFPGYARRVEITGSNGTVILEHDAIVNVDLVPGADPESRYARAPAAPGASAANAASPIVADATPHQRIVDDFVRAIRTGGTPICDGPEGRRSVAVCEAIYRSARLGAPVDVAGV